MIEIIERPKITDVASVELVASLIKETQKWKGYRA